MGFFTSCLAWTINILLIIGSIVVVIGFFYADSKYDPNAPLFRTTITFGPEDDEEEEEYDEDEEEDEDD